MCALLQYTTLATIDVLCIIIYNFNSIALKIHSVPVHVSLQLGNTAMSVAKANGHTDIVRLLQ